MKRHKSYISPCEYKALLPAKQNRTAGKPDVAEIPEGWIAEIRAALKVWELRQEFPSLFKKRLI